MMAAAEATTTAAGAGPVTTTTTTSRFAAACGALSQYVRAAEAERARAAVPVRPLPLMPGADVDEAGPAPAPAPAAQLTIVYGGRALVLDDVPADRAADLLRLAAAAAGRAGTGQLTSADDLPVARKASLQRFMEKRRERLAAQAPYDAAAGRPSLTFKSNKGLQEGHGGAWMRALILRHLDNYWHRRLTTRHHISCRAAPVHHIVSVERSSCSFRAAPAPGMGAEHCLVVGRQHTAWSKSTWRRRPAKEAQTKGTLVDRITFLEDRVLNTEQDMDINITPERMNASSKRKKGLNITSC